jgi:hypothetical protein
MLISVAQMDQHSGSAASENTTIKATKRGGGAELGTKDLRLAALMLACSP